MSAAVSHNSMTLIPFDSDMKTQEGRHCWYFKMLQPGQDKDGVPFIVPVFHCGICGANTPLSGNEVLSSGTVLRPILCSNSKDDEVRIAINDAVLKDWGDNLVLRPMMPRVSRARGQPKKMRPTYRALVFILHWLLVARLIAAALIWRGLSDMGYNWQSLYWWLEREQSNFRP